MISIKYRDRVLTSDQLHALGWALIDAGKTQDRYAIQSAQSRAKPDDEKEREQADMAMSRCIGAMRRARRLIAEATA